MWPGDLEMSRWTIGLSRRIPTIIKAIVIAVWWKTMWAMLCSAAISIWECLKTGKSLEPVIAVWRLNGSENPLKETPAWIGTLTTLWYWKSEVMEGPIWSIWVLEAFMTSLGLMFIILLCTREVDLIGKLQRLYKLIKLWNLKIKSHYFLDTIFKVFPGIKRESSRRPVPNTIGAYK